MCGSGWTTARKAGPTPLPTTRSWWRPRPTRFPPLYSSTSRPAAGWSAARLMQCPVCEAENLDDAVECAGCGRTLAAGPGAGEDGGSLEGLETTHFAPVDPGRIEFLPGVEPTQLESDPQAPSEW